MRPLQVFIGWDSREQEAYHVLVQSIITRTESPVSITPLIRRQLQGIYTRPRAKTEATEFSMTRFLVPYLCGYEGQAIFMDCDMLCRADITALWAEFIRQPDKAVLVWQHDYTPREGTKMDGQLQTAYPRKNWSSLMLFNNERCRALSPQYVNEATGLALHRFQWLEDDALIGSLPLEWNWLVGEYPANRAAKMLHYTLGGPWLDAYRDCDHAGDWLDELDALRGLLPA